MNLIGLRIPVTLLYLLASITPSFTQATFQKYMSIADSLSEGFCVAGLGNGNIAVGGIYAQNLTSGSSDAVIFMLDENGTKLWTLKLGNDNSEELINDMEGLSDGGLLVSYISIANNEINFSSIVRISSVGEIIWSKKFANDPDIYGPDITKVTGGFILNSTFISGSNVSLIKIDNSGNMLWSRTYEALSIGSSGITEDNQGNIHIAAGRSSSNGAWIKLNGSDGSQIAGRNFNSPNFLTFDVGKVIQNDSLLLIGSGYTNSFVLLKTDLNGNPGSITRYTYGTSTLYPLSIQNSGNGEFVLSIYQEGGSNQSGILAHFSSSLNVNWSKTYANNGGNPSYFLDMDNVTTGYVMCGTYKPDNKERALIVKTDFNGDVFGKCCPKNIDLNKSAATVSVTSLSLTELPGYPLENFTITGTLINSVPTPICVTNEKINASDTLVCPGQCVTVLLGGSEQGVVYSWDFAGGTPESSSATNPGKVCYNTEGTYPIKLSSDNCLLDSVSLTVDNTPDRFPNAFSPNGDGTNEVFKPLIECPVEEYRLQIFSRWGDLLFETYDVNEGWNGEANGEAAPVDVYVYRVEFFAVRNGIRTLVFNEMKEVTLIR